MGYDTNFSGEFTVKPALKNEHREYLAAFAWTRRVTRDAKKAAKLPDPKRKAARLPIGDEGGYYVGSERDGNCGQDDTPDVIDRNTSPKGQPGVWCQWVPSEDGKNVEWDGGEKFYNYVEWLEYLVKHFLKPWGYRLDGEVEWEGDDREDMGKIVVRNSKITVKTAKITYD
jgi:hypothetical protein